MGYDALGNFQPGEDASEATSTKSSLDTEIAATEKDLAAVKDKLRIANQSLKSIDPKYETNKAYISKLNTQVESYKQEISVLEAKLDKLKKQKGDATGKKPAPKPKPPKSTVEDVPTVEVTSTKNRFKTPKRTYNPLGKFSSYTYRITMYMISPSALSAYMDSGVWNKNGMYIVAQSAGADGLRAPGFEHDYFIDNVELETATTSKESGTSGIAMTLKFDIFEPYGMTFLTNLIKAANAVGNKDSAGKLSEGGFAMSQFYLLTVRFYGYDEKGNLVTTPESAPGTRNKTDDPGLFERTFPFTILEANTKLDNKVTRYNITAAPLTEQLGFGAKTTAIQEPLNISGDTVSDILSDSPTSLIKILNTKEEALVKAKKKEIANVYKIKFEENIGIDSALLVDKQHYVPSQSPLNGLPGAVNVREANKGGAATVSKSKRSIQIPAGTRIPQAIEQIISQSTYITDCLSVVNKEVLQPVTDGEDLSITNPSPKELVWFAIVPQIKYLAFDSILKSNAYEITFYVKSYAIPFFRSEYFPNKSKYNGPDKIFNYWYTGQNEGVLSFNMTFNNLYQAMGSMFSTGEIKNSGGIPMSLTTSMGEDTAGKMPGTSEEVASLKSWLFMPEEQQKATMTILGDPDFLMTAAYGTLTEMTTDNPAEESPINPVTGTIYIEIDLRSVNDYNADGTMKPEATYQFWKFNEEMEKELQGRMLYQVNKVKSKFSKGVFTQEFTDLILPPTELAGTSKSTTQDAQSREKAPSSAATKGKSLDPVVAAKARSDFAKIDPRRLDLPRPTKHDNGKPILAPVRTAEDEFENRKLDFKGYDKSAQVFNKDAGRRDSVTLLPKKQ